jgi:hypothetical protein
VIDPLNQSRRERLRILLYARSLIFSMRKLKNNLRRRINDANNLTKIIVNVKNMLSKEHEALAYMLHEINLECNT